MSFITSFEKQALLPSPLEPKDMYENSAKDFYQLTHSPWLAGAKSAVKYGLPVAAVAALASPKGKKQLAAAALGSLVGGLAGIGSYSQQKYDNMTERAHLRYHLEP
jgi:hypothetical protein